MTEQERFRSSLEDVIAVAAKLAPFCRTVDDLVGMARLGLSNDAQMRVLMTICSAPDPNKAEGRK